MVLKPRGNDHGEEHLRWLEKVRRITTCRQTKPVYCPALIAAPLGFGVAGSEMKSVVLNDLGP
jgi:hypothetical protein